MAIKTHSTYTVYKRIANLLLITIGVAVGANLWWVNKTQTTQFYSVQAQQLGRSLVQQKALDLTHFVEESDSTSLQLSLEQLLSDPHVTAASIYDFRGRVLANVGYKDGFVAFFKQQKQSPLTFVANIERTYSSLPESESSDTTNPEKQIIGYLQVELDPQSVMAHHNKYQEQLNKQRIVFMILAALGALYITRAFYKLRFRFHRQLRAKQRLGKQR
ncbi:AhpA/YtjB family protein [Alteromonas facilis]|uniref:AhpA/YtjB family protein n=1 Tax=Alteromonas facilis TaxID=2048004 RepID=UPI000C2848CD|nr:AhpA/YtjB family protein [Alteromonas facilis]